MTATEKPPLLILPGWIRGFCPVHVLMPSNCNNGCMVARHAIADLQAEYDAFWPTYQQGAA